MKKLRKLLGLILFLGVILIFSDTKSFAATEYTENVIPAMTSDTAPSGTVSASGYENDRYAPWLAFDYNNISSWSAQVSGDTWLEYKFPEAKCITKYTMLVNEAEWGPKTWNFEGWDEVTNEWIILDQQTKITTEWREVINQKQEFTFTNTKNFTRYRLNITERNTMFVVINEIEMMETIGTSTPPISQSLLKVVAEVGETLQLSIKDDLSYNTQMTWTSSDSTIATVDNQGRVTGVNPGNAVITVTNQDGTYTDTINVLVIEGEEVVAIDLKVGESRRLTIDDLAGTTPVTWTSDNQTIATISSTGKVTAVAQGTTYVIVKDDQGNEIGKICVRVRN